MTVTRGTDPDTGPATTTGTTTEARTPWGRYAVLYVVFFLMGAEMYLVSPLLPTISTELGGSVAAAAGLVTSYVLTYAIAGPLLGVFADRIERRVFITAGVVVFALGNVLCALAPTLGILIAARAVTGLGGAAAAPAIWAYLAERTASHQRGKAISWGASIYSLGQVLGVPLGAAVAVAASWRWSFAGIGVLLACTVPVAVLGLRGPKPNGRRSFGAIVRPWRTPTISLGLVATALLQAGRLGTYSFVGVLFSQRFGFSLTTLGFVGLLVGAGSFAGSLLSGHLVDRARRNGWHEIWLSVGWGVLFSAGVVFAITVSAPVPALVGLFVWFLAGGAFYSTQQAYLSTADPEQRASVVSWNNSMMNAGVAVGTTALGALALGGPAFTAVAAAFGLLAALASAVLVRLARRTAAPA